MTQIFLKSIILFGTDVSRTNSAGRCAILPSLTSLLLIIVFVIEI